jgi:hypothetical protein
MFDPPFVIVLHHEKLRKLCCGPSLHPITYILTQQQIRNARNLVIMKKQGIDHAFEHIASINVCIITQRKKMLFTYKFKRLE